MPGNTGEQFLCDLNDYINRPVVESFERTMADLTHTDARAGKPRLQENLELAATVTGRLAHDFVNILTGILGFTELTLAQRAPETLPHRYHKEVQQSATNGAAWIHKLQLFGRRIRPTFWPTTLGTVLAEEAERLRGKVKLEI